MTGYAPEEVIGRTPAMFKSGRHGADFYLSMWQSLADRGAWFGEIWDRRKNGEVYPLLQSISAVRGEDDQVTHYVAAFSDISERKEAEEKIRHLAFYDPLTHLPNRRLLLDRLQQAMVLGERTGHHGALLFIDLDQFKSLNDTLGHDVGDLLLIEVARRLQEAIRESDTAARLGGDEFVIMLEELAHDAGEAAEQARLVGEKVLAALNRQYHLAGHELRSTPSIGLTLFKGRLATIDELMRQADLAMYQSKSAGRNALHFFDPKMQAAVLHRVQLDTDLRNSLEQGDFRLHYQPQVDAQGKLIGAEALLRWQHPQRGTVLPGDFIALAEETGFILPLGQWVLETACQQLAQWSGDEATAGLTLSVNVSARQFHQPEFVESALEVLRTTGAPPARLRLELTESLMLDDVESVIAKMKTLKSHGIGFALDDFGTGYSSLTYLRRLPLDLLKIDRSFVNDILTDPNVAAIARTIVTLAHSLGLTVVAEGVEQAGQFDFLVDQGCSAYQGYYFGRPVPAEELLTAQQS
jgi:diguanylate cyclase (GGDEF)-like protein/PAS domain S-box-containing protein